VNLRPAHEEIAREMAKHNNITTQITTINVPRFSFAKPENA